MDEEAGALICALVAVVTVGISGLTDDVLVAALIGSVDGVMVDHRDFLLLGMAGIDDDDDKDTFVLVVASVVDVVSLAEVAEAVAEVVPSAEAVLLDNK